MKNTHFYFIEFLEMPMCPAYLFFDEIIEHSMKFIHRIQFLIAFYETKNVHLKPINHEQWTRMNRK